MPIHVSYLAEEIDGAARGVRVIVPMEGTSQAQRGSLCALVDVAGIPQADALTDRLLSAMQRTYYTERGTQSHVIMETVRKVKLMLESETAQSAGPWRAGVVCVGIMSDRIAVAGLGSTFALVSADGGAVSVHPPERLAEHMAGKPMKSLELWPLHRQKLDGPAALLAGSSRWLDLVAVRTLAATAAYVDAGNCVDAAEGLREQAGAEDVPGFVLVIDSDAAPPAAGDEPPPPPDGPAPAKPPGGGGLPTAVNASPPVVSAPPPEPETAADLPPADAPAEPPDEPASTQPAAAVATAALAGQAYARADYAAPAQHGGVASASAIATAPDTAGTSASIGETSARLAAGAAEGARVGLNRARDFLGSMLPESVPATETAPVAMQAAASAGGMASIPAPPPKVRPATEPFVPPDPASGSRARMLISAAVIILVLVPAIVAAVLWQRSAVGRAEADAILNVAEARLASARDALDQDDPEVARQMLTDAEGYVGQAEDEFGTSPRSAELRSQIAQERKAVERVAPLYGLTTPLIRFAPDAEPQQVMVAGQDIYVLDTGRNAVTAYRLTSDGEALADPAEGQVVLRSGDVVDGVTAGPLLDLAWQAPVPGFDDKSSLLVLDANNNVFRYNQQVDGASVVEFGAARNWQQASQIETFLGRLYVTDVGANQIYRYDPGRYEEPTNWFLPETVVNLAGLKSMRIDSDIWLLFENGTVLRYRQGEQMPYSLDNSVTAPAEPADIWVGDVGDETIYLGDALAERILVFDKATGEYLEQFQAAEGTPLNGLRSLFVDTIHSTQYILTDSNLFQERLPQ